MEYKGKNYNVVLTYRCKNCGALELINPEYRGKNAIDIGPAFMAYVAGEVDMVPIGVGDITHMCTKDGGRVVVGPMSFETVQVTEINNPETGDHQTINKGENDGGTD